jgi:hypothetical protein
MSDCVVQEVTLFEEIEEALTLASNSGHQNSVNYEVDRMKKRWNKYHIFTKLMMGDELVSFAGVYDYGNNLVRVIDRIFTFPKFRQRYMTKSIAIPLQPALHYLIPYHTRWALDKGFDCFFSIQEFKKRNSLIRLSNQIPKEFGYRVLPDMYATCDPKDPRCIQSISATTDDIHLPKINIESR